MAPRTAEGVRQRMDQGSLHLRGVVSALRLLAESNDDDADLLRLLARDVDLEADAMGEAEVFLLHQVTEKPAESAGATPPAHAPRATSYRPTPRVSRLHTVEKGDA